MIPGLLRHRLGTGTTPFLLNALAKASFKAKLNENWGKRTPPDGGTAKISLQRVQTEGRIQNLGLFCNQSIIFSSLLGPAV